MADSNMQTDLNKATDTAADAARRATAATAGAAHKAADAAAGTAKAGIDAEQRSFGVARDAARQGAEVLNRAAQTSLKTGQDFARQASDQAADFWRNSLTPMSQLQTEFGRWIDQMWRQPMRIGASSFSALPMGNMFAGALGVQPAADLRQTKDALELCVELPGLKPDDIDLSLRGDLLVLSGERADGSQGQDGALHFSERRFGRFERSFPLPPGADRSKIDASYQDGLLRVTIPLSADGPQEQSIPVKG